MKRAILLLLFFPALAAAQAPLGHEAGLRGRLAPGLWQRRQALKREFDASGGSAAAAYERIRAIDAQYRRFVEALGAAYAKKRIAAIDSLCGVARSDPEAAIACGLVRYRLDGRRDPGGFLAALPARPETASALDDLRQAAARGPNATGLAAAPVYRVTQEIFRLMLAGSPVATSRYFYLLHHSDGAWADDAADELEHYLADHPADLIRNWPVLRNDWNLSDGITWDVDAAWWESVVAKYRRVCARSSANCREILSRLEMAARAAGAPG